MKTEKLLLDYLLKKKVNTLILLKIYWKTRLKSFTCMFYAKSLRKFFETGVLGMGRSGYMKRQIFFVPPYLLHDSCRCPPLLAKFQLVKKLGTVTPY